MIEQTLSVGDLIEVKTERLAYGGEAIARYKGLAIFIALAAPDETLRVRVIEKKKNFARAVIEEILTPSPFRIEPRCRYYGDCGGCQLQHIQYETQLQAKAGFIRDALRRTGNIDWPEEIKIYSAADFNYRLRARLKIEGGGISETTVGSENRFADQGRPQSTKIGFNRANSHSVCDIERCEIVLPELNEAITRIRRTLSDSSDKSFNQLNEIDIAASQEAVAGFPITNKSENIFAYPAISSFTASVGTRKVADAVYQFDAATFFQVNAFLLDDFVNEAIGNQSGRLAIDLYAGVGLFTVQLARRFQKAIGVEDQQKAFDFAKHNFALNRIENAEMICASAALWLNNFIRQHEGVHPDLVVLDPPRSGAREVVGSIARLKPSRIHYISCDPVTLARDLKTLIGLGFQVERIVAFDMFPQTYHVETIVYLKQG